MFPVLSLRRASNVFSVVLALIAGSLAVALFVLTSDLHRGATEIRSAAEGLRLGEEFQFGLVALRDARDDLSRSQSEEFLRSGLATASHFVSGREEAVILDNLRTKVDTYIAEVERTPATPDQGQAAFDAAFAATRQWTQINLEQSRAVKIIESRLDRVAGLVALAGVILVSVGIGSLAWWLRRRTFAPALQLVGVIERYAGGERSARAAESGAQELRTIAHQFNDMASTLEQQRTNQLTFLAGVAHDLRNPLAAMKLAVEMVPPDKPLPPEERVRQLFARMERQTARLERMVYDFLDASRIESGDLALAPEACDVCVLVRATAELFESTTRTHRLAVSAPSCPVLVTCDPTRIEQVLSNVVSNALKYSPAGGTVTLTVSQRRDAVEIAVTDQGVGMSADEIRHAFEPFRRFAPATGGAPGIGLGLFVAKRIVKAHGGDISIESSPGAGATFRIRLPVTRNAPQEG